MHQLNATEQKWFDLIQEARSSGLSDKAWCQQNNVPTSTFYYHIHKLRNKVVNLRSSCSPISGSRVFSQDPYGQRHCRSQQQCE